MITQDIDAIIKFHGHLCPGLAIGIRAAEMALMEIGPQAADEELVAIVETDMCGVYAIQFITGCTFGKGNLIHLDYGKNAFTFIRRSDGQAIRIVTKPQSMEDSTSDHGGKNDVVVNQGDTQNEWHYKVINQERVQEILDLPFEVLFDVEAVGPDIPHKARIRESIQCQECGECVMETRVRFLRGRQLCIPCFKAAEKELDG